VFGFYPHFQVFLCAFGDNLAKKFGEFGGVFRFLIGGFFPIRADFGIAFPERYPGHGQVHSNFTAFAVKVRLQVLYDVRVNAFGYADHMLGGESPARGLFLEFPGRSFALGASLGRLIARVYKTAN
jgi:hypothetical protein